MTIIEDRPALWTTLPGWGIAADLIPRELKNARRLKALRKKMAAGIAVLLAVCVGGYLLAAQENLDASSDLAAVQGATAQLQGVGRGYADVVAIQGTVSEVQTQIVQVMGADVDLPGLMGELRSSLPETMAISQELITISTAGVAGAATGTAGGGLDTSGLPRIGTITLNATGQSLDDVADYVDRLKAVTGLADVLSISNISPTDSSSAQFTITMGITNVLLSHRFDVGTG